MLSYCFKCRQNTESENPRAVKSKREKPLILSKRTLCGSKNSRFIKEWIIIRTLKIKALSFKEPN